MLTRLPWLNNIIIIIILLLCGAIGLIASPDVNKNKGVAETAPLMWKRIGIKSNAKETVTYLFAFLLLEVLIIFETLSSPVAL